MATLRYINTADGTSARDVDVYSQLIPDGLKIPKGVLLSFRDRILLQSNPHGARPPEMLEYGKAWASIKYINLSGFLHADVQIESPNAKDYMQLRKVLTLHFGGNVVSLTPSYETVPSLVDIVRADVGRIRHWATSRISRICQSMGMRLAGL